MSNPESHTPSVDSVEHDVSIRLLDRSTAAVSIFGTLDGVAVEQVGAAMDRARETRLERLVVDFSRVTGFTPDAPAALHRFCRTMTTLPRGLAMQAAATGAGREALLATLLAAPDGPSAGETLA